MTVFQGTTCAKGIRTAINKAIVEATTPGAVMHQLLDGADKVLVIEWNGSLDDAQVAGFNAYRGDGKLTLMRPDHRSYLVPPSVDVNDAAWNIRAGVPLWLLNISTGWPITVGIGVLHPVFTSATVVFYDHRTNHALGKMYFSDPRIHRGLPLPEGVVSMEEERERIEEAGGAMEPSPLLAPLFGKPWF